MKAAVRSTYILRKYYKCVELSLFIQPILKFFGATLQLCTLKLSHPTKRVHPGMFLAGVPICFLNISLLLYSATHPFNRQSVNKGTINFFYKTNINDFNEH